MTRIAQLGAAAADDIVLDHERSRVRCRCRVCCWCSAPAKLKIHGEIVPGSPTCDQAERDADWGSPTPIGSDFYTEQTEYGLLGLLCGTGASGSRFSAGMIWLGSAHFAKVFLCCLSGLDFGIFGNFLSVSIVF